MFPLIPCLERCRLQALSVTTAARTATAAAARVRPGPSRPPAVEAGTPVRPTDPTLVPIIGLRSRPVRNVLGPVPHPLPRVTVAGPPARRPPSGPNSPDRGG